MTIKETLEPFIEQGIIKGCELQDTPFIQDGIEFTHRLILKGIDFEPIRIVGFSEDDIQEQIATVIESYIKYLETGEAITLNKPQ